MSERQHKAPRRIKTVWDRVTKFEPALIIYGKLRVTTHGNKYWQGWFAKLANGQISILGSNERSARNHLESLAAEKTDAKSNSI